MNNLISGILTIALCLAGYAWSWKLQAKGRYRAALLLLLLCGLALRIYTSTDFFLHEWDERYHALVAKNLLLHPGLPTLYENPVFPFDYTNWSANHVWLHKQPFPMWIMALSMWIFGINEMALRLPSILLTTLGIALTYSIADYFANKRTGYLAAFFFSINGLIIELTGGRVATDHIDVFFLVLVELAVYFSVLFARRQQTVWNVLAGIAVGFAILTKWLPALIVMPVWILVMLADKGMKPRRIVIQFIVLSLSCLLVFLPWQIYIFQAFPKEAAWEAGMNLRHMTEVMGDRSGPFYYFFDYLRINYGELVWLAVIWYAWKTARQSRDPRRLALMVWLLVPLLFFTFARTKMQAYTLFTCPAVFIMTAEFWIMLSEYREKGRLRWLVTLLLVLFIALPVRYTIERVKPFDRAERTRGWVSDLKELNRIGIKNGVLFNYYRPVEAMFYTDLTAYHWIPGKKALTGLVASGKTVVINDNGNIPEEVRSMKGIVLVKLRESE